MNKVKKDVKTNINIISDNEQIRKIFKEENIFYSSEKECSILLSKLIPYFYNLPSNIQDEWVVYAHSIKTPIPRFRQYKNNVSARKLRRVRTCLVGKGDGIFVRLNQIAMIRKIINKPKIYPPFSVPTPPPPTNLRAEVTPNSIILNWEDYTPLVGIYDGYKKVNIFHTLYSGCSPTINGKKYNLKSRILSVLTNPSKEQFTLNYLILPNNKLIKLSDVPQLTIRFQMDTIVLVDDLAPTISSLSNICEVKWNKNNTKNLEEIEKDIKKIIPDEQVLEGKEPRYIKSSRLITHYPHCPHKYTIEKEYVNN